VEEKGQNPTLRKSEEEDNMKRKRKTKKLKKIMKEKMSQIWKRTKRE
jgi:hypothetical protein